MNRAFLSVLGAGAWGTALGCVLSRHGRPVLLWGRDASVMATIAKKRRHPRTLTEVPLPRALIPTTELKEALSVPLALVAVPTQALRGLLESIRHLSPLPALLIACKGIEKHTQLFPLEIAQEVLPRTKRAVLSGPNFAVEIAQGLPSATTIATRDFAFPWLEPLASDIFRPYLSDDPMGVQLCGALKNVLAIACGAIAGKGLGESAKAAALSRGAMEIARLGERMGAKTETLLGLAGLGDMTLTCMSPKSRNFSLGYALVQGQTLAEATEDGRKTCEGMHTVRSVSALAERYGVDMPLCKAIAQLLYGGVSLETLLKRLMRRPLKQETIEAKPVETSRKEVAWSQNLSFLQPI